MRLRVASFNLCNLSQASGERRFQRLAATIVNDLSSPSIIALQEVAAESPPSGAPTVSAAATFERLNATIELAGGPRYEYIEVSPRVEGEGGAVGQNIRVAYLVDPKQVAHQARGHAGPEDPVSAHLANGRLELSASPARLAPSDPAFRGDSDRRWHPSRRVLAAEILAEGNVLFFLNCHFKSMRATSGRSVNRAKQQRQAQARIVAAFVRTLIALDGKAKIIVLGDMNDTPGSKSLQILKAAGLRNLLEDLPKRTRYSRRHGGRPQLLDHVLVSRTLAGGAQAFVVHGNADAPPQDRGSDHDPVLAELQLGKS